MKQYEVITVCGVEYQLKISTANAVQLEAELQTDILTGLEKIVQVGILAKYYFAALKGRNDTIQKIDDVYDLFDDYLLDGGSYESLQELMIEILVISGIMSKQAYETSKKAREKLLAELQKSLN